MLIPDGPIPYNPIESANAEFQKESPSATELFGNNVASGFTRKAGSFLAENVTQGIDYSANALGVDLPNAQKVPAAQINDMAPIGNDGKPTHITDEPMSLNVANMLIKDKQRQLVNENMTSRYQNAHGMLPTFAIGAASFLADPSNLAMTYYGGAILGGSKVLAGLGALGVDTATTAARVGARVVSGSVGGAASMVPLAGAQMGISAYQNGDYDVHSALNDLAFSAVGGAIIHGGFGSILHETGVLKPDELMRAQTLKTDFQSQASDILRQPATTKAAAINSAISDVVNGRPADPESVIGRRGQPPDLSQIADDRRLQNQNGYSPNMTPEEISAARQAILPNGIKVEKNPSRLPDNEIDRYKTVVQTELQKIGVSGLDDSVVREIARIKAEQLTPEVPVKPRTLADVESGKPKETSAFKPVEQAPAEVAPRPIPVETFPKLPKELAGAKSGYKTATPQFASDVDKALYIVREKSSGKSKSHDKYIDYLKNTVGLSDGEIRKGSEDVLNAVKQSAEGKSGKVDVPSTFKRTGTELSLEDIASNKKMQSYINRSEAAKNKKMGAPKNMLQSIASAGGMKDENGFLKEREMRGVMTQRGRLYQKNGMTEEQAYQHAVDHGWIEDKGYDEKNPDNVDRIQSLRDALEKEHMGKNDHVSDYEEDLERHAGEMGIDTTGMKTEEIRDLLEKRTKEANIEKDAFDELEEKYPEVAHDYYPDMEEDYADEATSSEAHNERESEVSTNNERSEAGSGNTTDVQGAEPVNTSVAGRGTETEGAGANGRGEGTDSAAAKAQRGTTFEPAKNVVGGGEQGVLGGMEQSAKQAMAARGEKISPKVEQKPADEGLFKSVIGGGDELDLRIADAEKIVNASGMTVEERSDLQEAYKNAADADKAYAEKMKELGQCLNENGIV